MNVGWFYGERENETRREMGESFPPNINNLMFCHVVIEAPTLRRVVVAGIASVK